MKKKGIFLLFAVLLVALAIVGLRSGKEEPISNAESTFLVASDKATESPVAAVISPEDGGGAKSLNTVTTEEQVPPVTAMAHISRADGSVVDLSAMDGEFERVLVEANEELAVRITLANADSSRPVRVEADNGGSFNHQLGPLVIRPPLSEKGIEFSYTVGGHRGRYVLLVTQGSRQESLEFYVGMERASGEPGPVRIFHANERKAEETRI